PVHRQRGDIAAAEADGAGIRRQLSGKLCDQRGLASTVRADYGVQLAGHDRQRQVVGRDDAAEAFGQPLDVQQRFAHERTFLPPRPRLLSSPSMPPRANSTTSSKSGPSTICQYSEKCTACSPTK